MNPLRKTVHKIGLDIHRYRPEANRLAWVQTLGIRSVFDIGANVGQFATEIRHELPEAQIYSFEPLQECYGALTETFRNDSRFEAFPYALGEKDETVTMHKSSYTPSSSLREMAQAHKDLFPHTKESQPETIRVRRLDDAYAEISPAKPLLIKVDTQGYEDKVIMGGMDAFRNAAAVIIEASYVQLYEGQPLFDDIYSKMKALGFSYRGALHQKIKKETGEVIFEDSIYVR
jgi:FkbM family methyltransferase